MSAKPHFGKTLVLLNILEKKRYEILTSERKPSGRKNVFTEQNSGWYLTINVGIGMKSKIRNLVDFMVNFGKNGIVGY